MKFFIDNCLPVRIVRALEALGVDARHLKDEFDENTKDLVWMPVVAKHGWIVVTDDNRIRKRPSERALRTELKLTTVFLAGSMANLRMWDQATKIVHAWPAIEAGLEHAQRGTCLLVSLHGKVERLRNP